ncbi:MAG TPA: carboxypeptidase-like regulatory domain-containing protein, partial [Thermoanaerobaculia bacterium]
MSASRRCLLSVVLLLALTATAAAQTTGSIVGRVTDEAGGVLPGVSVEARSPALQGSRTAVTDSTGAYRLELLPPGEYTVTFTLEGYANETHEQIAVSLGRDTTLPAALRASVSA